MNHLNPSIPEYDDELSWLAFRYIAGELTDEETESFEARLADDLAACEAVAAMSELAISAQTAAVMETLEPARITEDRRSLRVRLRSWIAVGSTAIALGWLLLLLGHGNNQTGIESPGLTHSDELQAAADLIARWSQVNEESVFADEALEITLVELSVADESERPDIPGWMIAAVSLENDRSGADDMPDMPSNGNPVEVKEN